MQWRRQSAKSSRNKKKNASISLFAWNGQGNVAVHKKCLQGNNDVIFDWLVGDLFAIWLVWEWFGWLVGSLWVVCGWFDWFVGSLAGLCVIWLVFGWFVGAFTANAQEKLSLTQMFSCEFCEISKNTFFTEHVWTTASFNIQLWNLNQIPH